MNQTPIDWGLSFAWEHRRALLCFLLLPLLVELFVWWLRYYYPLEPQEVFLVVMISSAADAWLLSALTIFTILALSPESSTLAGLNFGRRGVARMVSIGWAALRFLPKVLVSYLGFYSLVMSSYFAPPLFFLVIFFVWAPLFCAAELVVPGRPPEDSEDDGFGDEDDFLPRGRLTYFQDKSVFALGFARSLHLSSKNLGTTFLVVLLIWVATTAPRALVDLFASAYSGYPVQSLKLIFSSTAEVLARGAAAAVFLIALPAEARKELPLSRDFEEQVPQSWRAAPQFQVQGRPRVVVALALVAALSTALILFRLQQAHQMPESAEVQIDESEIDGKHFVVVLRMADAEADFRWLDISAFQVEFGPATGPSNGDAKEAADEAAKSPPDKPRRWVSTRERPYGPGNTPLPAASFTPYYETLKLVLHFERPEELPAQGEYKLLYRPFSGSERVVYEGAYGG